MIFRSAVCAHGQHALCEGYVIQHAGQHGDASKRYLDACECSCGHGERKQ